MIGMELKDLERILSILKENGVVDFELTQDSTHIKLSRGVIASNGAAHSAGLQLPTSAPVDSQTQQPPAKPEADLGLVKVQSPIVGTFYTKPSPDSAAFVREGSEVKKGQTLCIIEAMKLMNEIECPSDGRIEKILIGDGQVVEFGEVLFLIRP